MGNQHLTIGKSTRCEYVNSLSIVLINAGRDADLMSCCADLARHETRTPVEVIVVTTATPDAVRRRVEALLPAVRWVEEDSFGVASMRNRAAALASGDVVLFLDTDTRLLPGALDALFDAFGRCPRLGAAGARILNPDGSLQFSARRFYTFRSLVLRRIPGRLAAESEAVRSHLLVDWDHNDERSVDWVVGACLAISSDAFAAVGPFDEDARFGFEDVSWCYRARLAGWDVRYIPAATVVHEWARTSAGLNRRTAQHLYGAARFFLRYGMPRAVPSAGAGSRLR